MKELILCKYGEIALKGLNKNNFESILVKNVKRRLRDCGSFKYSRAQSTLYIEPLSEDIDMDEVVKKLSFLELPSFAVHLWLKRIWNLF